MPRILFNKSIEDEYKINKDLKREDIKLLKNWCSSEKHLPKNISDLELYIFLHSNYYEINETKKTIEAFYSIRSNVKEFFCNRDPIGSKDLRDFFNVWYVVFFFIFAYCIGYIEQVFFCVQK